MDGLSDSDVGGLVLLALLLAAVVAVLYVIITAIAVTGAIGLLVALGIGANVLVRAVVGAIGDQIGPTPTVAQFALVTVMVAPMPVITTGLLLVTVIGSSEALLAWLAILVVSCPTYYWAYWAREVPRLHWKLDLPFKTEAAMRAEERILIVQVKGELVKAYVRTRLFIWGQWADLKAGLASMYQTIAQILSKIWVNVIGAIFEPQALRDTEEENGSVPK